MAASETSTNEHYKRRMNSRQATIERHAGMELVHRRVKIDPRHNSKQKLRDLREAGQQLNYLHNFLIEKDVSRAISVFQCRVSGVIQLIISSFLTIR